MTEQPSVNDTPTFGLGRALAIPLGTLLLALLLIYSGSESSMRIPEVLGGDRLRKGLRTISVLFGLSCFPGGLIGTVIGYLLVENSKLASASFNLLRIGQWAPFVLWWPLVQLLLTAPDQQPGRYFLVWTISIPAVALGTCYHFLCTRHQLGLEWRTVMAETAKLAVFRALYISLVLALSVWSDFWVIYPGNENVARHYVAISVLALFLVVVHWVYRSGLRHYGELHRDIFRADFSLKDGASFWTAALIVLFFVIVWQLLNLIGYFRVSPLSVFNASVALFSAREIWLDIQVSLLQIFAGVILSGALVFIVSGIMTINRTFERWILPILSLTFVIPIVMLPAWHGWLLSYSGTFVWTAICVACLSFFPVMQAVRALREERLSYRILVGVEHALPYGFAATLYGQMMSATAGLGFAVAVATATYEIEKAFAVFLITILLLLFLSTSLRLVASGVYSRAVHAEPLDPRSI
jgi:ABC-type nitrate/sulfonate/bicarbonate transport system permease component